MRQINWNKKMKSPKFILLVLAVVSTIILYVKSMEAEDKSQKRLMEFPGGASAHNGQATALQYQNSGDFYQEIKELKNRIKELEKGKRILLMLQGHEVYVVDNFFTGRKKNVEHWIGHNNFELIHADIVNPLFIEGLAKRVRARLLLASTSEVYGDPEVHPQTEDYWGHVNPIGPRSCYDEGKRAAESLCYAYKKQIYGKGEQTRSFQYVSDLVNGLIALMNGNYSMPVNLGNPDEYTITEFAEEILKRVEIMQNILNLKKGKANVLVLAIYIHFNYKNCILPGKKHFCFNRGQWKTFYIRYCLEIHLNLLIN
ncbi:UXS1-like protein, partial [Mya arenaria]